MYVSENIEKRVLYSGNELFMDIWEDAFVRIMLQVRWAVEVDSAEFDSRCRLNTHRPMALAAPKDWLNEKI